MAFIYTNPNPKKKHTGDCSVRAVSIALGIDWDHAYDLLYKYGKSMKDMENATVVINKLLTNNGFVRKSIPDTCPSCYTIWDFCEDHPAGTYVLSTGSHVVTVINGNYYDTWDSGDEVPLISWRKCDV